MNENDDDKTDDEKRAQKFVYGIIIFITLFYIFLGFWEFCKLTGDSCSNVIGSVWEDINCC